MRWKQVCLGTYKVVDLFRDLCLDQHLLTLRSRAATNSDPVTSTPTGCYKEHDNAAGNQYDSGSRKAPDEKRSTSGRSQGCTARVPQRDLLYFHALALPT